MEAEEKNSSLITNYFHSSQCGEEQLQANGYWLSKHTTKWIELLKVSVKWWFFI